MLRQLNKLESLTQEGDSPLNENEVSLVSTLEYPETRMARGNPAELTAKAKYML